MAKNSLNISFDGEITPPHAVLGTAGTTQTVGALGGRVMCLIIGHMREHAAQHRHCLIAAACYSKGISSSPRCRATNNATGTGMAGSTGQTLAQLRTCLRTAEARKTHQ